MDKEWIKEEAKASSDLISSAVSMIDEMLSPEASGGLISREQMLMRMKAGLRIADRKIMGIRDDIEASDEQG